MTRIERSHHLTNQLFEAVRCKSKSELLELLNAKISPNCINSQGIPLIVETVREGFHEGLQILAPLCNLNRGDPQKCSALHISAKKGDSLACQILLDHGAHANLLNAKGRSPLYLAARKGHKAVVECFIKEASLHKPDKPCPIDLNISCDSNKDTPLIGACRYRQKAIIELLLEAKVDTKPRDRGGYTAKALCVMKGLTGEKIDQIPMDPYTQEFLNRKVLGHFAGVNARTQVDGTSFYLSGCFQPYIHQRLTKFLEEYFSQPSSFLSTDEKSVVLEAMRFSNNDHSAADYFKHFQDNRITIVITGWIGHAINVVFFDDYLCIVNAGEGVPMGCSTLETTLIDKSLVSEDIFKQIISQPKHAMSDAQHFFYGTLPLLLVRPDQCLQDDLCCMIAGIAPHQIEIGICTIAAAKGSIRFCIMMVKIIKTAGENFISFGYQTRVECRNFSIYSKHRCLELNLEDHFVPPDVATRPWTRKPNDRLDLTLIRLVYRKIRKDTAKSNKSKLAENHKRLNDIKAKFPQILVDG